MINFKSKLPKLMRDAMDVLNELHNTPDEMSIQAVLGVVNFACQSKVNVDSIVYGVRPISLDLIALAPTGAAKSTLYRELMVGVDKWCDLMKLNTKKENEEYEYLNNRYEKDKKEYWKEKDKNPTTTLPMPMKPDPSPTHKYYTSKGTVNGIIKRLERQPMVGLFSAEAGEFFNGHAFQNNALGRAVEMTAFLTSLWDGNTIDKNTGEESIELCNRRVNMLFLLQPELFKELLDNPIFSSQGFLHRLLITHTDSYNKPDMPITNEEIINKLKIKDKLQPFHNRIFDILNTPFSLKENTAFELDLPTIYMDNEATELLARYNNEFKNGVLFNEDEEIWHGFAERLHEHPLRIAANLTYFEGNVMININNAHCAIELYEFYCEQRRTLIINSSSKNSSLVKRAREMNRHLIEINFNGSRRDLIQSKKFGFDKLTSEERDQLIKEILEIGEMETYKDGKSIKLRVI
jgi:hypothetical protein